VSEGLALNERRQTPVLAVESKARWFNESGGKRTSALDEVHSDYHAWYAAQYGAIQDELSDVTGI
jgi:hypothetical protein